MKALDLYVSFIVVLLLFNPLQQCECLVRALSFSLQGLFVMTCGCCSCVAAALVLARHFQICRHRHCPLLQRVCPYPKQRNTGVSQQRLTERKCSTDTALSILFYPVLPDAVLASALHRFTNSSQHLQCAISLQHAPNAPPKPKQLQLHPHSHPKHQMPPLPQTNNVNPNHPRHHPPPTAAHQKL